MFDLWYSEGPGTSRYRVLIKASKEECEAFKLRFSWSYSVWEILPHDELGGVQ